MSSRYIQITPWALLEYEYANQSISLSSTKATKIQNDYTQSFQFVNGNIALNLTGNVLDRSAVPLSPLRNRWGYTDIDAIVPLIGLDPKLTATDITSILTTSTINYDIVKIHIVSGFNLEGLDGLIAQIQFQDRKDKMIDIANHVFRTGETQINFNSLPIFLGDRLYDRFIEFKIPALTWANQEFLSNPNNPGGFAYNFTSENLGFKPDSLIAFSLYEINSTQQENSNIFFLTGNKYEVSFLPVDQFGLLGAVIRESNSGDYFEYFATWDNALIENYIANLNAFGGNWAIVHQINIIEQVGLDFIKTTNFTMLQDSQFDKPIIYRPVIVNAGLAFSFSIDYTMRLFNRNDGQQIIRRSSITSYEPKKYGREIEKITVQQGYRPVKVYNKIVTAESSQLQALPESFIENSPGIFKTIVDTRYIPTFYNNTNISLTTRGKDSQELDGIIFGQGKAILLLNEYDNRIRFKMYDKRTFDKELEMMNLSSYASIRLSFIYDDGQKIYINSDFAQEIDPTTGEIEFLINSEISSKLLNQSDKRFFLVSTAAEGNTDETVLYQGKYENFSNRDRVIAAIEAERIKEIDKKIKQLEKLKSDIDKRNQDLEVNIQVNQNLVSQIELENQRLVLTRIQEEQILEESRSAAEQARIQLEIQNDIARKQAQRDAEILDKKTAEYQLLLSKSIQNNKPFDLKEIPGEVIDLGSSIKAIRPVNLVPSSPSTVGVTLGANTNSQNNRTRESSGSNTSRTRIEEEIRNRIFRR
jgi:hypothetical protein